MKKLFSYITIISLLNILLSSYYIYSKPL